MLLNASLYPDGRFYRQHDSDEAEERWLEYTQSRAGFIMIPKDEAVDADIDPERHAYIDRPDIGMVGYAVIPEAMHQMHCVNELRRHLYYNIEETRKTCTPELCLGPEHEKYRRLHIDHCLEEIRQRIECTTDMGIGMFCFHSLTIESNDLQFRSCGLVLMGASREMLNGCILAATTKQ